MLKKVRFLWYPTVPININYDYEITSLMINGLLI